MDVWFSDDEIAAICNCEAELATRWGTAGGRLIGRKLEQIAGAPSLETLSALPGNLRPGRTPGTWMINAGDVAVITFEFDGGATSANPRARVLSVIESVSEGIRR